MRVYGIVLNEGRVLSVNTYGYDVFPGGKKVKGEDDASCLKREFSEEFSGTQILVGDFYKSFFGVDARTNESFFCKTYFCYLLDELRDVSNEIISKKWVDSKDIEKLNLTDTSKKTLLSLIEEGGIN